MAQHALRWKELLDGQCKELERMEESMWKADLLNKQHQRESNRLRTTNRELSAQNNELCAENEELRAQNDELCARNEELSAELQDRKQITSEDLLTKCLVEILEQTGYTLSPEP